MDRAVLDAYGWNDIPTDCEFLLDYEIDEEEWGRKKKPYRYRWPEEVHDEVLGTVARAEHVARADEEVSGRELRPPKPEERPQEGHHARGSSSRWLTTRTDDAPVSDLIRRAGDQLGPVRSSSTWSDRGRTTNSRMSSLPGRIRPSNWYLTGFLIPSGTPLEQAADADENEDLDETPESAGLAEGSSEDRKAAKRGFFPSSMGLSFLVPAGGAIPTGPRELG